MPTEKDTYVNNIQLPCEHCKDWGATVDHECAIACPKCGRLTHPNEGVNIPAGSSIVLSGKMGVRNIIRAEEGK